MIIETLSKKPKRKLNLFKYKCISSIIIYPLALLVLLYPNLKIDNIDWKFIIGCVFVLSILAYLVYINLKTYTVLKDIDLADDTVMESTKKTIKLKACLIRDIKMHLLLYL